MPNLCTGFMNVRGYAPNVDEFVKILQANYSYYKDAKNGDYSTNIALMLTKILKDNPMNIASKIASTINDESKQEYIIYIKETLEQKFKFAFTTNENPGEMDLIYINSISDLGKNQVAFLDAETYEKISIENKPIFMWAKDENENLILNGFQIDLTK